MRIDIKCIKPRLSIHAFISLYYGFLCLIFQAYRLFFIRVIIYFVVTATVKNCVFLASNLNRIFVLLEMFSQYLATVIIRGVFRAAFTSIIDASQGSEFASDHDTLIFSHEKPLRNLFFS